MGYGSRSINDWVDAVHETARRKGWWDSTEGRDLTADEILSKLMLINTELAEAAEEVRAPAFEPSCVYPEKIDGKPDKPCGFPIEIADAAIRIFDLCGRLGIDLEQSIRDKHAYNETRPIRHGGKRA